MTKYDNDDVVIRDLLTTRATWAVVGLSQNRSRTAYSIAQFLKMELGMRIVPIHPRAEKVFGSDGYATLADVGSSRVDLQACKLEYSIVSPK